MHMTSAVPLIHSAVEFRLQVLCKAMCLSDKVIKFKHTEPMIPFVNIVIDNKHGLRKAKSIASYKFFWRLGYNAYQVVDDRFGVKGRTGIPLGQLRDNPLIDQKLFQLLIDVLTGMCDAYNKLNSIMDMRLNTNDTWYSENDSHYFDIDECWITGYQRKSFKHVMLFKNNTVTMLNAMEYFVRKSTEQINKLDSVLNSYYLMYELKK